MRSCTNQLYKCFVKINPSGTRVLVPTPSTKGGGGSKLTPQVSQEQQMLQT